MEATQIASIAANVLYLAGPEAIDRSKSLFTDYGMSSLDFVDLAFEVRAASSKQFQPEALWPVNSMMTNPDLFAGGTWTEAGSRELAKLFDGHAELPGDLSPSSLHALFSVAYIEHRLRAL